MIIRGGENISEPLPRNPGGKVKKERLRAMDGEIV